MAETKEPPFEPPFTVKVDGKVRETLNSWEAAIARCRHLDPKATGAVQAFDKWGREVQWRRMETYKAP
jgi:hypothetical protein